MLKTVLGFLFITTILEANIDEKNCKIDLNNIVHFYYKAEKELDFKSYDEAIINFKKSYNSSYAALDSCKKTKNYDFNHMYNYIIESENRIQKIKEDMLEFSLIKN
ncbi:MAG: hypothetical protein U9P38_04830 [Campylobacterota bacterium]|nr:hypothetical protein [Campylobacterota bacterium]